MSLLDRQNRFKRAYGALAGFFMLLSFMFLTSMFGANSLAVAQASNDMQAQPPEQASAPDQTQVPEQTPDQTQVLEQAQAPEQTQAGQDADTPISFVFDPLSAESWMKRLTHQVKSLSFEIVYVVSANKRETLPYMWRRGKMPDNSSIEQLSLLNGPGFEQVVHQGKVSIFEPGFPPYSVQGTSVQGPIPQAFVYEGQSFAEAYDVLLMGRNRVAGRMAQQIRVISKDKTRYGYHLWLDEQTGLLLKVDMYDLDNSLLEQIQVTQLTVSENVNQIFAQFSVDQLPQVKARTTASERDLMWRASYLPQGMRVLKQDVHRIERTGQITEYMLLSDGLIDVSVYVLPANAAITEDISVASGSHAVVSKTDGRIQVTVVGEIPVPTADKIANSIVIVDDPNG
ncbi:MucB/RseB C-terminal domain-containing protein [Glaciecola siphonariae]|uniref:MucB/RseB C-terminal domain-containing protein n=1 Tax=Glaciecola siphonariae TaxID=521012 RepID=A0ABV9M1Q8_9ALTE